MKKNLVALLFACAFAGAAHAQYAKCKYITDLSVPITAPGKYCLNKTLVGTGLVINADDVSVDLRGFSIINSQVAVGHLTQYATGAGIKADNYTNISVSNITVRNGTVVGFDFGVMLGYPAGVHGTLLVENLLIRNSKAGGIWALGYDNVTVRNNTIKDTVGPQVVGIRAAGRDDPVAGIPNVSTVTIENNLIDNVRSGTQSVQGMWAAGIHAEFGENTVIADNTVTDIATDASGHAANGISLQVKHTQAFTLDGNLIMNGVKGSTGNGISITHGNDPTFTGPIVINGYVNGSRVYNFPQGVMTWSTIWENGRARDVINTSYSNNVVGNVSPPLPAYRGAEMVGTTNRTE